MKLTYACIFLASCMLASPAAYAVQLFPPSNILECNADTYLAWAGPGTHVYCKKILMPPPSTSPQPTPPVPIPPKPVDPEPGRGWDRDISGRSDGLGASDLGFGD